ncbi:MAG: tetratricopeptide repeat protein [Rhodospirillales bacterium]|nr:tetratricopeptide repeat protein [Rhodospirillales bacterium]
MAQRTGRPDIAARLISKAIARDPGNAAGHLDLAQALHAMGRLEQAAGSYRAALEIEPRLAQAHLGLGNALAQQSLFSDAATAYRKARDIDPGLIEAQINLGNALAAVGRFDDAIGSFRAALRIQPDLAQAHYNLGNALKALGRLDDAAASYRRVIGIDSNFIPAHMNLGNTLAEMGLLEKAAESFREVLRRKPDHAAASANLGDTLKGLNRLDEAVTCYRTALRIEPNSAQVLYDLGRALRAQGGIDDAIDCYRRVLAIAPDHAAAHASLGDAMKSQGRLEEAAAYYRQALALEPDYADARTNLGLTLQQLGRIDEAIEHFERLGGRIAKARVLECLYGAGRRAAFGDYLSAVGETDPGNLRVAAISAFAAQQWRADDPYPFCPDPLDFIHSADVASSLAPFDSFVTGILEEIESAPVLWEPHKNATKGGFHTTGNLFHMETPRLSALKNAVLDRIADYRAHFAERANGFMAHWPHNPHLYGWHVRLLKSGYMEPHIHTSGWVSGVVYLKMPDRLEGEEGAITFSLHGYDYPIEAPDIPSVRYRPKAGDLLLFPSSLFHHTSRFASDEERHCIAFDLCP